MLIFIGLLGIIFVCCLILLFIHNYNKKSLSVVATKKPTLTLTEQACLAVLKTLYPERLIKWQIPLVKLIADTNPHFALVKWNIPDFILVDETTAAIIVIEVDDRSHL